MRRYGAVSRQGDPESPSPWPAPVPAPAPAVEWNTALFYDYEVADDLQLNTGVSSSTRGRQRPQIGARMKEE